MLFRRTTIRGVGLSELRAWLSQKFPFSLALQILVTCAKDMSRKAKSPIRRLGFLH
jgi:hypothetical protein